MIKELPYAFYEFISQIVPGFVMCIIFVASGKFPMLKDIPEIAGSGTGVLVGTWFVFSWVVGLLLVTLGKLLLTNLGDKIFGNPYSYLLGGGRKCLFQEKNLPMLLRREFNSEFQKQLVEMLANIFQVNKHLAGLAVRYAETMHPWSVHFAKFRALYLMARSLSVAFLIGAIIFYGNKLVLILFLFVALLFFTTFIYRRTWRARMIYESLYLWFALSAHQSQSDPYRPNPKVIT
jgi:hypothetical protein